MQYKNLKELYWGSASSRRFFLSQSVEMQLALSEHGAYIHTALDLHRMADALQKNRHAIAASEMLFKK